MMMHSRIATALDRIPMLSGLVGVTLYELPTLRKSEVHGTPDCYSRGGCRCDACTLANADRIREWQHASGRSKTRRPWAEARRAAQR